MFLHLYRVVKFAFQNFWRNFWLSIVTISIITLSFLSVNFFIFTNALVDTTIQAVENRINITVNFKTTASEPDILVLKNAVEKNSYVESAVYISKQIAFEKFRAKQEKEGNTIVTDSLDQFEENPLFASLLIKAKDINYYPAITQIISQSQYEPIIEKTNLDDKSKVISTLSNIKQRIQQVGWIINIFFLAIAVLIVYNTIRITIYTRKEEIGIMKLVGATNWYIRAPLVLESVIYSVIAIIATVIIVYPLLGILQPYASSYFDGQAFDVLAFFSNNFLTIFGYELLASVVLNVISSAVAIGRYLRV
ncbi:MAG: permease-like cell division protein FtsX [bacterium]|nr:permease-like cell division protein FtsX [bacterium]